MIFMLSKTNLYREIHEQPGVLTQLLLREQENVAQLAVAIKQRDVHHVVIAARGTSDNAGRYAKYLLGGINQLPVSLATPSLYSLYQKPPCLKGALVLGISQSGQSPDIVAVLAEAKRQGALTAVITNTPNSPLADQGEFVIALHADEEKAVAATKTYTTSLTVIAMLSAALAMDESMQTALAQLPEAVARTLTMRERVAEVVSRYRYMQHCVVIGRGYNYATAFETALKMKELTYTIVEPYSSADFLHGPLAVIEQGFPVMVIAPTGALIEEMRDFCQTLTTRQAEVVAISDHHAILNLARIPLPLPATVPEWLSPITSIIPGQLFSMYLAHARDFDVDSPRGLKKVTETH